MPSESSILELFRRAFGGELSGVEVAKAPGRVNLIGEHTDYNDGFVLPVPIDRHVWIAAKRTEGDMLSLFAADYGERASSKLDEIEFDRERLWANYVMGVADVLMRNGHVLGGANLVISGDVPIGAGLSSSAAIEVASIRAFTKIFNLEIDAVEMAYIGKSVENDFVGVQSGIMDQFVGSLGRKDHALFIDCRTNEFRHIPLDPDYSIVIVNTMVKRELASSAYNERRMQCEEGVRVLGESLAGVDALRDVTPRDFEEHRDALPDVIAKRCHHVVYENARVIEAVEALEDDDMERFGELMYESHRSLRDDYEVSCEELDVLVETARMLPGAVGARMTGAGFGGCTVNIVEGEKTQDFIAEIKKRYLDETGLSPEVYLG
ncbi:MAG: galactokinase [Candidatus Bathyarchaeota archaeon]|nr:galactokinase [Candidatus Bathyarchaeota archaeon]